MFQVSLRNFQDTTSTLFRGLQPANAIARFLRNIKDDNFLAAAKSLNLFLTSSELRAISFQLDKRGEGVYDLSKVFAMRPTQTDAMTYQPTERVTAKQSIDPRQLQQLLDRIAEFLYKGNLLNIKTSISLSLVIIL